MGGQNITEENSFFFHFMVVAQYLHIRSSLILYGSMLMHISDIAEYKLMIL